MARCMSPNLGRDDFHVVPIQIPGNERNDNTDDVEALAGGHRSLPGLGGRRGFFFTLWDANGVCRHAAADGTQTGFELVGWVTWGSSWLATRAEG